ncbi:hypothetical protein HY383_04665 [Candidatus Daviesbacteria bacterium]|nr:hypothetical protein [Candidatus Daviesbacteria bacterium]
MFSVDASSNRQALGPLLPRIGIAAVGALILSVPLAAILARSEKKDYAAMLAQSRTAAENTEDIERNGIMPGLHF